MKTFEHKNKSTEDQPTSSTDGGHPNPFDLSNMRLTQDFTSTIGVKKRITTIPVRKPARQEFVRVHPDLAYRVDTGVVELKAENETYMVRLDLWPEVSSELILKRLLLTMTRQGVLIASAG
jgi:hypothetical protein